MVHLNDMQDEYGSRGFTVVAVTNETRDEVDAFVEEHGATHPIVIEDGDSKATWGAGGFPSSFLIAPDGTVAWAGHPGDLEADRIEALLGDVRLFPDLPSAFARIQKSIEKGKLGAARKDLEKALADGDLSDEERAAGEKLGTWIAWNRDASWKRAEKAAEKGDYYQAWQTWDAMTDAWKGDEIAGRAKDAADALEDDDGKKVEIDAGEKLAKARRKIRGMSPKKAIKELERLTGKKYADTMAGKKAAEMIQGFERELSALKGG